METIYPQIKTRFSQFKNLLNQVTKTEDLNEITFRLF